MISDEQMLMTTNRIYNEELVSFYTFISEHITGPIFLVGGKVYRTLIEEYWEYPARSESADYDILCLDATDLSKIPANRNFRKIKKRAKSLELFRGPLKSVKKKVQENSYRYLTVNGRSIDLFCLSSITNTLGIKNDRSLETYLNSVPLDIQSIAFDFNNEHYYGKGIDAILSKKVGINNINSYASYIYSQKAEPLSYIRKKATSIKFNWDRGMGAQGRINAAILELVYKKFSKYEITGKKIDRLPSVYASPINKSEISYKGTRFLWKNNSWVESKPKFEYVKIAPIYNNSSCSITSVGNWATWTTTDGTQ